jgi:diaminopimelate decarboxylase
MRSRLVSAPKLTADTLIEIVERYGSPVYVYNIGQVSRQVRRLRAALPPSVEVLYSVKANPSLSWALSKCGLGADVASMGELRTALDAGFNHESIYVSGPYKPESTLRLLYKVPTALVSVDSVDEFFRLAEARQPNPLLLRLRPNGFVEGCTSQAFGARFGISMADVEHHRAIISASAAKMAGFHVFAASQLLDANAQVRYLNEALDLSLRVADLLGFAPDVLNLGGGFGVPYHRDEQELDISLVGQRLTALVQRAGTARVVLELGRYLVAQAGWYLTSVVGYQTHNGRKAVVVDGGVHQRFDICGLGTRSSAPPPLVLRPGVSAQDLASESCISTDVLGCLCLPNDILAEDTQLPELHLGDILAFPNSGAYGLTASPIAFLGHPPPAEVAFEENSTYLLPNLFSASY